MRHRGGAFGGEGLSLLQGRPCFRHALPEVLAPTLVPAHFLLQGLQPITRVRASLPGKETGALPLLHGAPGLLQSPGEAGPVPLHVGVLQAQRLRAGLRRAQIHVVRPGVRLEALKFRPCLGQPPRRLLEPGVRDGDLELQEPGPELRMALRPPALLRE